MSKEELLRIGDKMDMSVNIISYNRAEQIENTLKKYDELGVSCVVTVGKGQKEKYEKLKTKAIIIEQTGKGIGNAFSECINRAIREETGKIVLFHDDDIKITDNLIEKIRKTKFENVIITGVEGAMERFLYQEEKRFLPNPLTDKLFVFQNNGKISMADNLGVNVYEKIMFYAKNAKNGISVIADRELSIKTFLKNSYVTANIPGGITESYIGGHTSEHKEGKAILENSEFYSGMIRKMNRGVYAFTFRKKEIFSEIGKKYIEKTVKNNEFKR